jgi:hypothetical protein
MFESLYTVRSGRSGVGIQVLIIVLVFFVFFVRLTAGWGWLHNR